jgi:hypothetical protein
VPDLLSIVERGLKAVRYGFFCVNDQIALALDGFCHTPAMDYVDHTEHLDPDFEPHVFAPDGTCRTCDFPVSAVSPQAADGPSGGDLAPPLSPGATNPTGHPTLDRIVTDITELMTGERRLQIEAKDAIPYRWHGGRASAFREVLEMFANAPKK